VDHLRVLSVAENVRRGAHKRRKKPTAAQLALA